MGQLIQFKPVAIEEPILQQGNEIVGVALRRSFSSRAEAAELLCDVARQLGYDSIATAVMKRYVALNGDDRGVSYDHMQVKVARSRFYEPFDHVMTLRVYDPLDLVEIDMPWHTKRFSRKTIDKYFLALDWRMR
jgi:hypothetical protein